MGYVPLIDGVGLYEGGNTIPPSLVDSAPAISPIDGVIGVISLGMSNTSQEWRAFMSLVGSSSGVAGDVVLADGAVGGETMSEWAIASGAAWSSSLQKIRDAGLSPNQVQVVWMKMGSHLEELASTADERVAQERAWLQSAITNAHNSFPNLRRIYISSRTYAGYSATPSHSEPETGWGNGLSVRAIVADSVAGQTAAWTAWGPYLWADGLAGRSDGLIWECSDYEADGVHPSASGEEKTASMLWDFFSSDPTICQWFLQDPSSCGQIKAGGDGDGGPAPVVFDDVPTGSPFFADIQWLAGRNITEGCDPPDNSRFCPGDAVTRGQMAAFLTRALDLPSGSDAFTDDNGSVFESDINSLAAATITEGCNPPSNTRFCPGDSVTRGQMAAFLVRALDLPDGRDVFTDDDGSVFETDIQALAKSGITFGCNPPVNDHFCPGQEITRAEMAAFLHRAEPYLP